MTRWALPVIILLAFLLRIVGVSGHPAGFTPDEASFGYDAYSVLKTGKDQWGNVLPMSFKSFGDYKLPLYGYILVPFVAVFGLSELAVRLPNVLFGTVAVAATYHLVLLVWKKRELALTSAFLLAISPWHIPMSRGGFEANLVTLLLPLVFYFYFKGRQRQIYYVYSAVFFGLGMFSYHSARFIMPVILFLAIFLDRKNLKGMWGGVGAKTAALLVLFFLALSLVGISMGGSARVSSSSITKIAENVFDSRFTAIKSGEPEIVAKLFNNKLTFLKEKFTDNYLQYFSTEYYFSNGPGEGTYGMVPGVGVLYWFEIFFILGFIFGVARGKIPNMGWVVLWLFLAPVPAALALGPGFAGNRSAIMMPAIQIISAAGGLYLYGLVKDKLKAGRVGLTIGVVAVLIFGSLVFFAEDYWYQQPATQAKSMVFGSKEVVHFAGNLEENYSRVIVTKRISEPHIYFAFYNELEPRHFQIATQNWNFEEMGFAWVDQLPEYDLGKYTFRNIDWERDSRVSNSLLVGTPSEFPDDKFVIKKIFYPSGEDAYWIVDPQQEAFALK